MYEVYWDGCMLCTGMGVWVYWGIPIALPYDLFSEALFLQKFKNLGGIYLVTVFGNKHV